jgi:hypothetical protein
MVNSFTETVTQNKEGNMKLITELVDVWFDSQSDTDQFTQANNQARKFDCEVRNFISGIWGEESRVQYFGTKENLDRLLGNEDFKDYDDMPWVVDIKSSTYRKVN